MDLHTLQPYSVLKHGIVHAYPSLAQNFTTEVAIIGGGITGALVAWHLAQAGIASVVMDKHHIGMGSTAASTSLIQYEIDKPLRALQQMIGEERAVKSYKACLQAVYDLHDICKKVGEDSFEWKHSLQYASYKKDVAPLQAEQQLRKKYGFDVDWLEEAEVMKRFGIQAPAAILSKVAAQTDVYRLTHRLFEAAKNFCTVYHHTEVSAIKHKKDGVQLTTKEGCMVQAKHLAIACGYESGPYLPKQVEELHCTYTIVSEPLPKLNYWEGNCLIWETAQPYLYIRTTNDGRILVGGKDTAYMPFEKQRHILPAKKKALEKAFHQRLPHVPFKTDFQWAGAFAATKDGLPYIGRSPERPHTFFALGYSGNGITFSVLAAQIIRDAVLQKENDLAGLFSFNR